MFCCGDIVSKSPLYSAIIALAGYTLCKFFPSIVENRDLKAANVKWNLKKKGKVDSLVLKIQTRKNAKTKQQSLVYISRDGDNEALKREL
jgi:hypothetical protein